MKKIAYYTLIFIIIQQNILQCMEQRTPETGYPIIRKKKYSKGSEKDYRLAKKTKDYTIFKMPAEKFTAGILPTLITFNELKEKFPEELEKNRRIAYHNPNNSWFNAEFNEYIKKAEQSIKNETFKKFHHINLCSQQSRMLSYRLKSKGSYNPYTTKHPEHLILYHITLLNDEKYLPNPLIIEHLLYTMNRI